MVTEYVDGHVVVVLCRIFWSEGGSQPGLESALELTFGFPAVAALSKVGGRGRLPSSSGMRCPGL